VLSDPWIQISNIIVEGEIEQINPEANTVAIQVNRIYAPGIVAGVTQTTITANFRYASLLQTGQRAVFFANGEIAGGPSSLEILGLMQPEDAKDLSAMIAKAGQHLGEDSLRRRIENADLVVTGEVVKVEGAGEVGRDAGEASAIVEVTKVLKGHHGEKTVRVAFPRGVEPRWVGTPRFEVGDKGIWILKREHEHEYRAPGFQDFLLPSQLSRVEKALR
jgi:hypothetical protein